VKKGWETTTLGDTCEMYQPKTISVKDMVEDGEYPVYGANGVIGRYNQFNHEKPQLLITCRGATCGSVNISAPRSWVTGNAMVVKPKNELLNLRYLEYLFRGGIDISRAITGAAQPQITRTNLEPLEISFPESLSEQQRIVGLLDDAFVGLATAKANAEKNLQNARALFESHLQSVFSQRGEGWVETTLNRATDGIFTGPFGSLLHKSDYIENGIPLVNPAHITEVGIEPDLRKTVSKATALRLKNYIMREGDIVFGRRGEMGRCALVTEVEDGWLCGTGSFFIKPSSRCDTRYLVRFLRSDSCKARLEKIAGGAVMPNLSNTDLGNFTFDLPPLDRQKAIVDEIDTLHEETHHLARLYSQKLAALDALKKSLLHQAFSGEL
jgi:type I restriction enzyme, S subunit